ncbi:MAG: hypothetical protein ACC631_07665 [Halocynthiibacter sp.]
MSDVVCLTPMNTRDEFPPEIGLIGGYGDVGLKTARHLLNLTDARIVLAGRDPLKAELAARDLGDRVRSGAIDITSEIASARLSNAAIIINLVEACPPEFPSQYTAAGGIFHRCLGRP